MAKKVIYIIGLGISAFNLLLYLIATFMAPGSDWKAMLILLIFILPFLILGLVGLLIIEKRKLLSGIFAIISGIATSFLGLMCCSKGLPFLGILALPLGVMSLILYIISTVMILISK